MTLYSYGPMYLWPYVVMALCSYGPSPPSIPMPLYTMFSFQALDVLPNFRGKLWRAIDAEGVKKCKVQTRV